MNVQNASEMGAPRRPWDSSKSISLNRRRRPPTRLFKEKVEIRRYDRRRAAPVREAHQGPVNRGRFNARRLEFSSYRLPDPTVSMQLAIYASFEHA
jgi:hypothetical protein